MSQERSDDSMLLSGLWRYPAPFVDPSSVDAKGMAMAYAEGLAANMEIYMGAVVVPLSDLRNDRTCANLV